ncbi:trans-sulfuration enzyme family protein [Spirochaeta lutea]|uniref:O-succinylhomoserine sulfhydrylase n=1 Tax=Spirochaeta lutea TaxID=1480694 RepID=A0A098QVI2_9SPIO|nr:aminotransferase class I/II-fold pyridoxal phosphate-dependent enzyme [Spirochaeta lutea]KGE71398.1 O-succinylhomoserine sulfhydrylase [Spirochaeta lutea]
MKGFETRAIRTQQDRSQNREHSAPIYMTSSYVFDDAEQARSLFAEETSGPIYSRYSNPNTDEFIEKLCALEGTEDGFATASGMAAMFTSLAAFLSAGDHLVASKSIFGSTHQVITKILPRWGIEYTYVDCSDKQAWKRAIQPNTKMLYCESPSNPGLEILDLEFLGTLARNHSLLFNVDNCFATPYLQNPAEYGAHLVTHSATKFIDGQGRSLGGAVLGSKEHIATVRGFARQTGPAMSPFNAWLLSKSLETLAVRMDRHCQNALETARYLENRPEVSWVSYPGLPSHPGFELAKKQMRLGGGLVAFELAGGLESGRRFLDSLGMISLSANLGDTRTIATHPASTTHSKLKPEERAEVGISDGLVRISLGLESLEDILEDLDQALTRSSS